MAKKELSTTVHKELSEFPIKQGRIIKAQVVSYGNREPGLNLQMFWEDDDGEFQYGKRPLLSKDALVWIRDNDLINKAIEAIPNKEE